jgi:hypothetical protein
VQKGHTYYRCSKKGVVCSQSYIREEVLAVQLSDILKDFAAPSDWAVELLKMADADEANAMQSSIAASQAVREEITATTQKLQRLHRLYLDEDIERETYLAEKGDLLSRRKSLEGKLAGLGRGYLAWLEPLRGWIKDASLLGETSVSSSLPHQKSSAQKIFGSNAVIKNRRIEFTPTPPYASLREARLNFSEKDLVSTIVPGVGFEPTNPYGSGCLRPLRIPFRHPDSCIEIREKRARAQVRKRKEQSP